MDDEVKGLKAEIASLEMMLCITSEQLSIAMEWLDHEGSQVDGVWNCLDDEGICGSCDVEALEQQKINSML